MYYANDNADDVEVVGVINSDRRVSRVLGAQLRHRVRHQPFNGELAANTGDHDVVMLRVQTEVHQQKRDARDARFFNLISESGLSNLHIHNMKMLFF
ncbi:hypothetical protein VWS36_000834 [Cronobacter sakazakii]|nr:hypothetical protein [Cronobacter sakazakii]EMD7583676.1 hypothetical protein [Cronobacter sakazakii]EME1924247.1 hypothetical protein [Cronobacter sakazakii]EME1966423.1 hypothetical protein [Cronobacter sakazakii]